MLEAVVAFVPQRMLSPASVAVPHKIDCARGWRVPVLHNDIDLVIEIGCSQVAGDFWGCSKGKTICEKDKCVEDE